VALSNTVAKIQKFTSKGLSFKEAWDFKVNEDLVESAIAFMEYFNYANFVKTIQGVSNTSVRNSLTNLCRLYGTHTVLGSTPHLVEGDLITPDQLKQLRVLKEELLPLVKNDVPILKHSGYWTGRGIRFQR
jgi:hypothetical protein